MEFRESKAEFCTRIIPCHISCPWLTGVLNWWKLSSPFVLQIVKEAYPDHTQFDQKDPHYDSTSRKENPKWSMVMYCIKYNCSSSVCRPREGRRLFASY